MATFNQQGVTELQTVAPNIRITEPTPSGTASVIAGLGEIGIEAYKADVRRDMRESSEGLVEELNQGLQNIKDGANLADSLTAQLDEFAQDNPHIQDLKATLGSLSSAEKQRKGAKLLYTLKAEAELKRVLARAPGLRPEVTAVATRTLGVDPTSATIDLLLRNIEDEGKGVKGTDILYKEFGRLEESKKALNMPQEGFDPSIHTMKWISEQWKNVASVRSSETAIAEIQQRLAGGEKMQANTIMEYGAEVRNARRKRDSGLFNAAANMATVVESVEQWDKMVPVFNSQLEAYYIASKQSIEEAYSAVSVDAANASQWKASKDEALTELTTQVDGMRTLLGDRTKVQQRLSGIQVLKDQYQFDFLTSNELLHRLEISVPGLTRDLFTAFNTQNQAERTKLNDAIKKEINRMPPDEVRRLDLAAMVDMITGVKNIDDLDANQRERLALVSIDEVRSFNKNYNTDPSLYSKEDLIAQAKSYATVLSIQSKYDNTDWAEIANLTSSPAFVAVVNGLQESGDKMSAEILGDSAVKAAGKAANGRINDELKQVLGRDVSRVWMGGNKANVTFDAESGKFVYSPYRKSANPNHTDASTVATNGMGRMAVDKLNKMFDSLYDNKLQSHDPSLSKLDRAQLAHVLTQQLRRDNGIRTVGELKSFPSADKDQSAPLTFEQVSKNLTDGLQELTMYLQQSGLDNPDIIALAERLGQQTSSINTLRSAELKEASEKARRVQVQ